MKLNLKTIRKITTNTAFFFVLLLGGSQLWAQSRVANLHDNPFIGDIKLRPSGNLKYKPNEVLVTYKRYISASSVKQVSINSGASIIRTLKYVPAGSGPMQLLKVGKGQTIQQAMYNLSQNPDVESVQPNYIYHSTAVPDDTNYGQVWGLKNTGQTVLNQVYDASVTNPGTASKDINAETAWDVITDCSAVTVAVIDSGVNYTHEDLAANMVAGSYTCPGGGTGTKGCDFVGAGDADPKDLFGHGTHVAGIIGAVGNNTTGSTGVCWTAKILAVRVLDQYGAGTSASTIAGINFAVATGAGNGNANIINMSLGGPTYDAAVYNAITTAQNNGVLTIIAAGNSTFDHKTTGFYPCDYDHWSIICVAAVDQKYGLATFSDYDSNATAANRKVDIAAPGTNNYSTWHDTPGVISDTFNTAGVINWTNPGGWSYSSACGADLMHYPNWCNAETIGTNVNSSVYKNFDLSSYYYAMVFYQYTLDLANSGTFKFGYSSSGGDPALGTTLGSRSAYSYMYPNFSVAAYDITPCLTAACTLGFNITTGAVANDTWDSVAVGAFNILTLTLTDNTYAVQMGTSMATPYVAGIAAIVWARNPNYTAADVMTAIENGGDVVAALISKTKTGMVADAYGALKYIPDTVGLSLTP